MDVPQVSCLVPLHFFSLISDFNQDHNRYTSMYCDAITSGRVSYVKSPRRIHTLEWLNVRLACGLGSVFFYLMTIFEQSETFTSARIPYVNSPTKDASILMKIPRVIKCPFNMRPWKCVFLYHMTNFEQLIIKWSTYEWEDSLCKIKTEDAFILWKVLEWLNICSEFGLGFVWFYFVQHDFFWSKWLTMQKQPDVIKNKAGFLNEHFTNLVVSIVLI